MNMNVLRIAMILFWLFVATVLFFPAAFFGPERTQRIAESTGYAFETGGILAICFAAFNMVRWLTARRRWIPPKRISDPQPVEREERKEEYIPELDFKRQGVEPTDNPTPSANPPGPDVK